MSFILFKAFFLSLYYLRILLSQPFKLRNHHLHLYHSCGRTVHHIT